MKLIYHKQENEVSVFDEAIKNIAKDNDISIVSPYIGFNYINEIINFSKSWRLITDVSELLLSNTNQCNNLKEFIKKNQEKIHHCPNIHAKVIISNSNALLGSANFTNKGLTKRTEMSILIDEKEQIQELNEWFNDLWDKTDIVNLLELDKLSNKLNKDNIKQIPTKNYKNILSSKFQQKTFRLIESENDKDKSEKIEFNQIEINKNDEDELIEAIKFSFKNKSLANDYFDLVKKLITELNIQDDNEKLVMSIRKEKKLPITIGQRYIIVPKYKNKTDYFNIGLILPLEFDVEKLTNVFDITCFTTNKRDDAYWVVFNQDNGIDFSDDIINAWKESIANELKKSKKSSFREHHKSIVYKLIIDLNYRKEIFEKVFTD